MKHESLVTGAVLLIAANAVSKILGAVLKIPLAYLLGEQGMAIYQTAFSVYIMLLSLITSGLPFAAAKYIAEELAFSRKGNVRFAMRFLSAAMLFLGLFASLALFFGADFFAYSMKDTQAVYAIQSIAPAILLVALGEAYKSCFRGYAHQLPSAVSQVLESFVKLAAGYSLAAYFSAFSVRYSAAAAVFGVTVGEAAATLVLFLMYIPYRRDTFGFRPEHKRRSVISSIAATALPMTAAAVISGCLGLLETSVIRNRLAGIVFTVESARGFTARYSAYTGLFKNLETTGKLSADGARWLYGAYSGYAATIFNLPCGILAAFGASIMPTVTQCVALKNTSRLKTVVSRAAKITLTLSVPCAVIMCLFSDDILGILFKNTASGAMLSCLAPFLIIVTLTQLVCSVMYASGSIYVPFLHGAICSAVKIILSYVLVNIPELNIFGVIIAAGVSSLLRLILCSLSLGKETGIRIISFADTAKISVCGAFTGIIALLLHHPLCCVTGNSAAGFAVTAAISVTAYFSAVYVLKIITVGDIKNLKGI